LAAVVVNIHVQARYTRESGADPEILEKGSPVKGRIPEPSASGGGVRGPPPENFEKLDAISCNLAYILGVRMASDIIQN